MSKNAEIPGTERKTDNVLADLQLKYERIRDKRMQLSKDEKAAYDEMVARAQALDLHPNFDPGKNEKVVFVTEDEDGRAHELFWKAEGVKLKSRVIDGGADGEG